MTQTFFITLVSLAAASAAPDATRGQAVYQAATLWASTESAPFMNCSTALVPGQAMGVNLPDAGERADVIAFLRTLAKAKE